MKRPSHNKFLGGVSLYIAIYSITTFGSLLGMIGVLSSINMHFESSWALAVALSLRTVFMYFSGWTAPSMFLRFNIKETLKISELSGIIGVLVILISYKMNIVVLAVSGIAFLGLPGGLLGQGLVSVAKNNLEVRKFRKLTGSLSKITGVIFLLTGIVTPFFLNNFGIYNLLYLDLLTYILSLVLLIFVKQDTQIKDSKNIEQKATLNLSPKKNILLKLFPALLLIGLLPLISGQKELQDVLENGHLWLFRMGWAFEGLGMIIAGILYQYKALREHLFMVFSLASVPLLLLEVFSLFDSTMLIMTAFTILGTSYSYCYMKIRDDSLVKYGNTDRKAFEITGYFTKVRSLFCILSPLLLMQIFNYRDIHFFIWGIFFLQIGALIIFTIRQSLLLKRRSVC